MKAFSHTFFTILLFHLALLGYSQCSTSGTELAVNGGFECPSGSCNTPTMSTGQFPDYSPSYSANDCSPPGIGGGRYAITSDANSCFGGWVDATKTAHSGTYVMLIDGNGNSSLWCQTVAVTAGFTYQFSAWYQNAVRTGVSPGEIPELQLYINGSPITASTAIVTYDAGWLQNICLWQAPAATTTANICVMLVATSSTSGNDVLLDDISFQRVTEGSCTAGTCTYTGTLPVSVISLQAEMLNDYAAGILWKTSSETGVDRFIIERSIDGINYTEIGSIKAEGNIDVLHEYSFIDNSLSGTSGTFYYRLTVIGQDNHQEYFAIVAVTSEEITTTVFPNPISQGNVATIIYYTETDKEEIMISLNDMLGRPVRQKKVAANKGENRIDFSVEGLNTGIYWVEVKQPFGKNMKMLMIE